MKIVWQFLRIFGIRRKARREFPSWAKGVCKDSLARAKAAIESKGIKLKDHDLKVIFREASWWVAEPSWTGGGAFVNALTHGDGATIECTCRQIGDPGTIDRGSLIHEMGHHWLITNRRGGHHDPRFDDVLPGWKQARQITGV